MSNLREVEISLSSWLTGSRDRDSNREVSLDSASDKTKYQ